MIITYDKRITEKYPELYDSIQDSYLKTKILYYIDSDVRDAVDLKNWTKYITEHPTDTLKEIANSIDTKSDYDSQMITILRWVRDNISYKGDKSSWNKDEYWQTPTQTLSRLAGDCEDGAVLIYHLARLKGIPSNRMLLLAGSVNGGGHCWLAYKPQEYPLNFVFLDWCYWYSNNNIDIRNKFYIHNNTIYEYNYKGERVTSNYFNIWFAWNEDVNITKYKYDSTKRIQNLLTPN